MAITPELVVESLKTSREEFREIFLEAQRERPIDKRDLFQVLAFEESDTKKAFELGVNHAWQNGWLRDLALAIVESGMETGAIASEIVKGDSALHAIVNDGGITALQGGELGWLKAKKCTCKIMVEGKAAGTGVLIKPHLVLTAWHVVKSLFKDGQPLPYREGMIQIIFDDFNLKTFVPGKTTQVGSTEPWCVAYSPCTDAELNKQLSTDPEDFVGKCDYAVIALDRAIGLERMYAELNPRAVVPKADETAFLFQHAGGNSMGYDPHLIKALSPPNRAIVTRHRFLHSVNAIPGSSGGPFFDKTFSLFGIHQGEWSKNGESKLNRGVPIQRILLHLPELPAVDARMIKMWRLNESGEFTPVVGCDGFQNKFWKAVANDSRRILVIEGKKGRGKSFRVTLLNELLKKTSEMKLVLPAESFSDKDALGFVSFVCSTAEIPNPKIESENDYKTATGSWIKDEVADHLLKALDKRRNGKQLWLIFTNLNNHKIIQPSLAELFNAICELAAVSTYRWLRIVLDGLESDLPPKAVGIAEFDEAKDFDEEDFTIYYERLIAAVQSQDQAATHASISMKTYKKVGSRESAKKDVIEYVNDVTGAIINRA
jgi:hypothetical protein